MIISNMQQVLKFITIKGLIIKNIKHKLYNILKVSKLNVKDPSNDQILQFSFVKSDKGTILNSLSKKCAAKGIKLQTKGSFCQPGQNILSRNNNKRYYKFCLIT